MGYSKYPASVDDSESLPVSIDLVTPIAAETVNRLRDAIIAAQAELGVDPSREYGTVRARLDALSRLVGQSLAPGGVAASTSGTFSCPSAVSVGDMVYLSSSDTVDKANASDAGKRPAIGLVTSKPSSTSASVYYYGEVGGFGALTPGDPLFLGETSGQFTNAAPTTTGSAVQKIGIAKSATTIVLMITREFIEL